jgi:hypothetical protein
MLFEPHLSGHEGKEDDVFVDTITDKPIMDLLFGGAIIKHVLDTTHNVGEVHVKIIQQL